MRYLPHTDLETREMLKVAGVKDIGDLFDSIPEEIRIKGEMKLPKPLSEQELMSHLDELCKKNKTDAVSFLGAGSYRHFVPSAVKTIVTRSEFITPYTPYQPEISQGTLQTVFEYQSMICALFGMDVSNASHYDGATATVEAAMISLRSTKRPRILVADTLHPEYIETMRTILKPSNAEIVLISHDETGAINMSHLRDECNDKAAGLIAGYPNFFGVVENIAELSEIVHKAGGVFTAVVCEPISMGLLEAPGNLGADIVCAEGQAFGCGTNFGGPNLGIFAAKEKFLRQMPGRIVGQTLDADGKLGYVLTFATREQHIRREKATSNICSNEALCATTAAVYLSLIGKQGIEKLAQLNFDLAEYAKSKLAANGVKVKFSGTTFNEFVIDTNRDAEDVVKELAAKNIFAGVALGKWFPAYKNCLLVCVTELNSKEQIDLLANAIKR